MPLMPIVPICCQLFPEKIHRKQCVSPHFCFSNHLLTEMTKDDKPIAQQLARTKFFYKKLMKERDQLRGHNKHIRQLLITLRRQASKDKETIFEMQMEIDDLRASKIKLEDQIQGEKQRHATIIGSIFDDPVDLTQPCVTPPSSPKRKRENKVKQEPTTPKKVPPVKRKTKRSLRKLRNK